MQTDLCRRLGCENPVFAFSHCRDVVAAASRAGGFGVLGASRYTPEELEIELQWIDAHCDGRHYGIDILLPDKYDRSTEQHSHADLRAMIPAGHIAYFDAFMEREGVPEFDADEQEAIRSEAESKIRTRANGQKLVEVALRHPLVKLVVSALGAPGRELVDQLHERDILVGALVGSPRHAEKQIEAGVDVLVAQGTEAAGHTGGISTLVLVPQVVDIARGRASVLAAGGIVRGSQVVAMLALGAQGVWCGSLWLCTEESELTPKVKAALLAASSTDTLQTRYRSGKPVRTLRTKLSDAFAGPEAPEILRAPFQQLLFEPYRQRLLKAERVDIDAPSVGQGVGMIREQLSVRRVMEDLLNEMADAVGTLESLSQG